MRALVDFEFNGWGGSYDMPGDKDIGALLAAQVEMPCANGHWIFAGGAVDTDCTGLALTTEQCLLNPNRTPDLYPLYISTLLSLLLFSLSLFFLFLLFLSFLILSLFLLLSLFFF